MVDQPPPKLSSSVRSGTLEPLVFLQNGEAFIVGSFFLCIVFGQVLIDDFRVSLFHSVEAINGNCIGQEYESFSQRPTHRANQDMTECPC